MYPTFPIVVAESRQNPTPATLRLRRYSSSSRS